MPLLQTPDELADEIADLLGIYGAHEEEQDCGDLRRSCRPHFVSHIADCMRVAVENERKLAKLEEGKG